MKFVTKVKEKLSTSYATLKSKIPTVKLPQMPKLPSLPNPCNYLPAMPAIPLPEPL